MIKILEDKQPLYIQLLAEQDYTYKSVFDYVINRITDYNEYPGISLAYDEEYGNNTRSEVEEFAKNFVENTIAPKIVELGHDYEYDYSEVFNDAVDDDEDGDIVRFEMDFKDLVERKNKDWQDDIDELNRYYNNTR